MRKPLLILSRVGLLTAAFVAPAAAARPDGAGRPTLLSTAISLNASGPYAGQFDTLLSLAGSYDVVVDALSGKQQLTVFAPTDAAFEALFADLGVDGVNDIPVGTLKAVLLHHVAPGERFSGDVLDASRIRMLDKGFTFPRVSGGVPYIDEARIVVPDVDASNGVIHVIDTVLLP